MNCCSCAQIARLLEAQKRALLEELNPDIGGQIQATDCNGQNHSYLYSGKGVKGLLDFEKQQGKLTRDILATVCSNLTSPVTLTFTRVDCEGNVTQFPVTGKPLNAIATGLMIMDQLAQLRSRDDCGTTTQRIYKILGGDRWFDDSETPSITFNPDTTLRTWQASQFTDNPNYGVDVTVTSILSLLPALASSLYYRSGFHRYPATVPADMVLLDGEEDRSLTINDSSSWLEWLTLQLDQWVGQFPIEITYKDADNNEQSLEFPNIAEALTEITGLLLSIGADVDITQALAMKATVEAVGARIAAATATDYAAANAEFLGYEGKQKTKNVKIAITPGATNLVDALKESNKKVTRWEFVDGQDLQDSIKQMLIGVNIIKAAFYRPFNGSQELPGDRIRNDRDEDGQNDNDEWRNFVNSLENPPAGRRDPNQPLPDIRTITDSPEDA